MEGSEQKWLEQLWSAHAGHVFAYAARRVGRQYAEDVVANVFAVAWRHRHQPPRRPLPWLYGVARRVVSEHYRTEQRRARLVARLGGQPADGHHSPEAVVTGPAALTAVLAQLSERDREVLFLTAWEDLKPRQAAAVLGIATAAYRMRLTRARRHLKAALEAAGLGDLIPSVAPDGEDHDQ